MGKNSYKAQLNYYDSKWGWKSEGTASQGQWDGTGVRTGVLYFPGLAALKGKIINSVKLTATTGQTGYGTATTKTVYIYNSASQGGIKTSLNAGHRTGNALGSCKAPMWDNTKTFDVAFMAASIAAGYDTYCIYNGSSYTDYLKWTAVTLEVDWQEPATQPSLSASTVEMGKSVTINTPAVNSAYRHTLRYAFGGAPGTIATGIASSTSWTPPVSLASQIPSATAGSGTIYCDTYSGSTLLGTKSVSITLTVPGSVVPSAGTLSAALAEDTSGTGLYVKGMGKAKLTLSGASGAYSSITSYTITGGGWTATNGALTTGTLASAGNITFTATVTDSRGRKASTTRAINVIDYTKPGVAVCDVYRCDADGNRKKAGTYFSVEINASYSAITGNTLSITARYKKQSESSYGTAANVTNNGKTVLGGGNIGASTTYDVLVTVADKYNSLPILRTLSTKSVLQSFKRSAGAAIGKVAELANWLDIAWHTRIRGNLQVDGTISSSDQYRIKWQTIPDGADLNDDVYKVPGHYRSAQGTNKIANMPPNFGNYGAFELTVTGISDAAYCTQWLKDVITNRSWVRTQTNWKTPWTWTDWADIITTDIGGDYYAQLQSPNNLLHEGNEFTFASPNFNGDLWFNYRMASGNLDGNIGTYQFGNGRGGLARIKSSGVYSDTLGWETLWSGKLTSGSITITGAKKYAAILVSGHPGSEAYRTHICLPTGNIDGQMVTNMVYMYFATTYSGDDCTITLKSNPSNGDIDYVWGIVQWKG